MLFRIILLLILFSSAQTQKLNPLKIISSAGYKAETHKVQTTDGYLLTVHRVVPHKIRKPKRPPCLLMHGFSGNSLEFLELKNESLPFILASRGYDVYIGNFRGTKFSSHINFSKKSSEFWNFSFHELGIFDLSATIDFVLHITKSPKLFLVGYSQGGAASVILLSEKPEYNQKVAQVHLLAPAAFMSNSKNLLIKTQEPVIDYFAKNGMLNLSPMYTIIGPLISENCKESNVFGLGVCNLLLRLFAGGNFGYIETDLDVLRNLENINTPFVAVRQARHFIQNSKNGKFQQYDFGARNKVVYGAETAPEYDLDNVIVPVYLYSGGRDNVVVTKDVELLRNRLNNVVDFHIIKNFNHLDYIGSRRAKGEIYLRMLHAFDGYQF